MVLQELLQSLDGMPSAERYPIIHKFIEQNKQQITIEDFAAISRASSLSTVFLYKMVDDFVANNINNVNCRNLEQLLMIFNELNPAHVVGRETSPALEMQDIKLFAAAKFIHYAAQNATFDDLNQAIRILMAHGGDLKTVLSKCLKEYFRHHEISPEEVASALAAYAMPNDNMLLQQRVARYFLESLPEINLEMMNVVLNACALPHERRGSVLLSRFILQSADTLKLTNEAYIFLWQRAKQDKALAVIRSGADERYGLQEQILNKDDLARSLRVFFNHGSKGIDGKVIEYDWFVENVLPYFSPTNLGIGADDYKVNAIAAFLCSPFSNDLNAQKIQHMLSQEKESAEPASVECIARILHSNMRNKIINEKEAGAILRNIYALGSEEKQLAIVALADKMITTPFVNIEEATNIMAEITTISATRSELEDFAEKLQGGRLNTQQQVNLVQRITLMQGVSEFARESRGATNPAAQVATAQEAPSQIILTTDSQKLNEAFVKRGF